MIFSLTIDRYLVAEYPSNYLMQKFPTGKYITVNFVLWGRHCTGPSPIDLLTSS